MSLIFKLRNMAVQDAKGLYRGAIGKLIFKVVDGKQIVQATEIRGKLKSWMNGCYDGKISSSFYFRLSTF